MWWRRNEENGLSMAVSNAETRNLLIRGLRRSQGSMKGAQSRDCASIANLEPADRLTFLSNKLECGEQERLRI